MITIFPAAPGTMIIERVKGEQIATLTPVVGYQHIQGGVVFPLTAMNSKGLTRGRALITPDGFVSDPSYGLVCTDRNEWMALTNSTSYWEGENKAPKVYNKTVAEGYDTRSDRAHVEPTDTEIAATDDVAGRRGVRIPDKPIGKPQVFQTTSFWMKKAQGTNPPRLFKVEGGVGAPAKNDTGFEKIKRDDWMAMKKDGMAVIDAGVALEQSPDAEEDDGSDLI